MRALQRLLYVLLSCGVVALAAYLGHAWWHTHMRPFESTDNAYVRAHMAQLSPRVSALRAGRAFQR